MNNYELEYNNEEASQDILDLLDNKAYIDSLYGGEWNGNIQDITD